MPRGGYRPCSGRSKGQKNKPERAVAPETINDVPPDIKEVAAKVRMTPLDYMLAIMNDDRVEPLRRDRMAVAAAPYCHGRMGDAQQSTKKERREKAARQASVGKFAPSAPPKLIVDNAR